MRAKFGGELSFLVTEFTKMEAQLSLEVGGALMVSLDVLVSGVSCLLWRGRKNILEIVCVLPSFGGDALFCEDRPCWLRFSAGRLPF